ncbi:hypothetical protein BD626DRAFT_407448 [Schizophyllum amplum]|uniref:Uncharacterized protein n=1 Tax=Schizophyllum amplum TaxID=97359 RepID=A0A550C6N6_9AGAR|nr:hypothetical protein BD626DRAFT_407448 [Auriculariopsis ampla]
MRRTSSPPSPSPLSPSSSAAGQASAAALLADLNPIDACNGSNHYGGGHDCAFKSADGIAEGLCHFDASNVLTCVTD